MNIQEIDFKKVDKNLKDGKRKNIIYGAGHNGEYLYQLCTESKIFIDAFFDDDKTRSGNEYCGKRILSVNELKQEDKEKVNIIISSMYIPQIYKKCIDNGFLHIYAALDVILEKDTRDFEFSKYAQGDYCFRLKRLAEKFDDKRSKEYFLTIEKTLREGKAISDITKLYSEEKQYFLQCFKNKLDGCYFIDAGAYTGDTVREMLEENIKQWGGGVLRGRQK